MSETLKSIIDSYRSGLLSTPNIQVFEKKLSDETIKFPSELIADLTFDSSTFKNSDLINMEFINVNFESSCFEKCLVENCIFENTILRAVELELNHQVTIRLPSGYGVIVEAEGTMCQGMRLKDKAIFQLYL